VIRRTTKLVAVAGLGIAALTLRRRRRKPSATPAETAREETEMASEHLAAAAGHARAASESAVEAAREEVDVPITDREAGEDADEAPTPTAIRSRLRRMGPGWLGR
jgi:hypothetical protein